MADGLAACGITELPAVELLRHGVAKADEHMVPEFSRRLRGAVPTNVFGRGTRNPRKGADFACEMTWKSSDAAGSYREIDAALRKIGEVVCLFHL